MKKVVKNVEIVEQVNVKKMKVKHPEYGYVIFSSPTSRQEEILLEYQKMKIKLEKLNKLKTEYPNDFTLGYKIRNILNEK